jgi:glycosyltransferase involved in cell wall biosynthesis
VKSRHSISAIVPIYNELAAVPGVIEDIDRFLDAHFTDYEVLVVESGSTDGTAAACDALPALLPRVRVVHEGARNGFGSAVRAGVALAEKSWVWPIVVDMPFDLGVVVEALPHMDTCPAVLSYRSDDPRGAYRRLQSLVFNALGRALLGVRARHINSAFKVTSTALVRSLGLESRGWLIDAELIMRLEERGVPYVEIPVRLVDRTTGRSTVGSSAVVRACRDLIRLAVRRRQRHLGAARRPENGEA